MRPDDPRVLLLRQELLRVHACCPSLDELAAALREMAREGGPVEVEDPRALAERMPEVPESFHSKWVERFARHAARTLLEGRIERMADQSLGGLALAALDYVQFLEENAGEYHSDLDRMAQGTGLTRTQLAMLVQARTLASLRALGL